MRTLTENYELVIHEMIGTLREKQEEVAYCEALGQLGQDEPASR